MKPGTQIVYVPTHAHGNLGHEDVEHGFVTSVHVAGDYAYCRFWSKYHPDELRTKSCSELTPIDMLLVTNTHPQSVVDAKLAEVLSETPAITVYNSSDDG